MSEQFAESPATPHCRTCGTELAGRLLVCPACQTLVYRDRLAELAREAEAASAAGDVERAVTLWRGALPLLPESSRQYELVGERIAAQTAALDATRRAEIEKGPPPNSFWARVLGPLGGFGLLLWKLKFALVLLLTKGKLLLLGLTKFGTVATMLLSLAVYWRLWGWKFALGLIVSIYVHEMGHVASLRRHGLPAGAPTFIPGVGAFVRLHAHAATPAEDARIGLAGPIWGVAAATVAAIVWFATGSAFWGVLARTAAWINLFNLTPVWQLDGSRGFHALSRVQRGIATALIAIAWLFTREGILVLVGLAALWRVLEKQPDRKPDWMALITYAVLLAACCSFLPIPQIAK